MIVVDTNILVYFYLTGDRTPEAVALLEKDAQWAAPRVWRSEFRNVLCGYLRRGVLTFDAACDIQDAAEALIGDLEYDAASRAVLAHVRDSDCTAYDCEFVALAEQLGTRLVTEDKKLLRAFPQRAQSLAAAMKSV